MKTKILRFLAALLAAVATIALLPACDASKRTATQKAMIHEKWDVARMTIQCQLAEQQYEVGDYDKCQETLNQGFTISTQYAPLHILAAKVAIEKGQLEIAAAHLKVAVQIDGNNPDPYYYLGVVYQRWQNTQAASDYYQLAWDKRPASPLYMLAVVEMKITLGQYDVAEKLLKDKLIYFEESSAARAALAKLATLKGNYDSACSYYHEASMLSPDDLGIRQNYAECFFFSGKYAEAIPLLETLRDSEELTDKSSVLMLLGDCYMQVRRPVDARDCFDTLTRDYPHNAEAWTSLSKSALKINDLMEADIAVRKALQVDPNNLQALILAALIQQKHLHWDRAQVHLTHALQIDPKNTTVLCMLGLNAQKTGNSAAARDFFNQALAVNPKDTWAHELLASSEAR